ncbi:peptidase S8/S53 domain-containing protein [Triangularia verruculosa]|uniref:Peptidase S8/S53 domain-containing protein n=1 Tax=Triangularia verruculosa TaxID=2587418 RepID=A0AAN6XL86_9PEZI|nr:peptidase S8/S53 domain-containing protein [Triangularia verruculosa]
MKPPAQRIKVAILDTGLDPAIPAIEAHKKCIQRKKGWPLTDKGEEMVPADTDGHGTHVTGLLLRMAPDCDVYVAKIANKEGKPISPARVAEAIDHAVNVWKVDIISMSFGFTDEREQGHQKLREAINKAHAMGVLMFAGASNTGAHAAPVPGPAFPARHSNVFCIYAGDAMGNSSRINPTARTDDYNFLALGEAVKSGWPGKSPYSMRMSGTSVSTPIVAGLAASFLRYAYWKMPDNAPRCKEFEKMQKWLFHVSTRRNGYDVLSLSTFFRDESNEEREIFLQKLVEGRLP